ncbi:MAG TPA: hypothetical protein VEC12_00075 [Bacteroidia bacterium]|nr:hypothetical protein [Bacteroidia bacterium]
MKKLILLTLLYLGISGEIFGQYMEWGHAIRGDSIANQNPWSMPWDLSIDKDNYTYFLGELRNKVLATTPTTRRTLIKYTEDGRVCWYKNFDYEITAISAQDDSGYVYAAVRFHNALKIGNDSFPKAREGNSIVLIKADSSFAPIWTRLITDSCWFGSIEKIVVTKNEVLLKGAANKFILFKGKKYFTARLSKPPTPFPPIYDVSFIIRLEKNTAGSNKEWLTTLYHGSSAALTVRGLTLMQTDIYTR